LNFRPSERSSPEQLSSGWFAIQLTTTCNNLYFYLQYSPGAHIQELIAELKEMFPAPDADDLQADFLEYRNTLRRKCTLRTCCSCGENHSLDDKSPGQGPA
jgi:hypothetical protein